MLRLLRSRSLRWGFTRGKSSRKMNNYDDNHLEMRTMDLTDLHIFRSVVHPGAVTRSPEQLSACASLCTARDGEHERQLAPELWGRDDKKRARAPAGKVGRDDGDRLPGRAGWAGEAGNNAAPRGLFPLGTGESTAAMRLPV